MKEEVDAEYDLIDEQVNSWIDKDASSFLLQGRYEKSELSDGQFLCFDPSEEITLEQFQQKLKEDAT